MATNRPNWTTQPRRVRDLVPLEYNPRILDDAGRRRLTASLEKFGLVEIPVINRDNVVLAGHQRLRILLDLGQGDELIDVRVPDRQLTKEEQDEYNITSNVSAGLWDYEKLLENFKHINLDAIVDDGMKAQLAALSNLAAVTLPAEEQEFDPTPPAEPVTAPGDLYELRSGATGRAHRLQCADSTDLDAVARLMDGKLADLVVTDPPYNVAYEGKTAKKLTISNDSMAGDDFYQFLRDLYASMFASMKAGAPIYVFHADSEGANFRRALQDAGLKLSQCLVWVKQAMVLGRQDFHWKHEPLLYGWKEGAAHKWYSDRKQTTVLAFDRPARNADHPTMKPLAILDYLLQCSSLAGDVVFDPCGGSGSLLISCEGQGRTYYGQELGPPYCDVHVRRFVKFMRDNQRPFQVLRNGQPLDDKELARYLVAE